MKKEELIKKLKEKAIPVDYLFPYEYDPPIQVLKLDDVLKLVEEANINEQKH